MTSPKWQRRLVKRPYFHRSDHWLHAITLVISDLETSADGTRRQWLIGHGPAALPALFIAAISGQVGPHLRAAGSRIGHRSRWTSAAGNRPTGRSSAGQAHVGAEAIDQPGEPIPAAPRTMSAGEDQDAVIGGGVVAERDIGERRPETRRSAPLNALKGCNSDALNGWAWTVRN